MVQQVHELLTGLGLVEGSTELAGGGDAVLFLHTAHLHAHVACFDHNHHSEGVEGLLDALLDLERHALLDLQAVGIYVDNAGYLAEPGDVSVGNVGHMSLAVEGQHVVFAEGEEVDVLDDDHLRVVLLEECASEYLMGILGVALREKLHGLGYTHRGLEQSLAGGVFA